MPASGLGRGELIVRERPAKAAEPDAGCSHIKILVSERPPPFQVEILHDFRRIYQLHQHKSPELIAYGHSGRRDGSHYGP